MTETTIVQFVEQSTHGSSSVKQQISTSGPEPTNDEPPKAAEPSRTVAADIATKRIAVTVVMLDNIATVHGSSRKTDGNGSAPDVDRAMRDTEITLHPRSVNDTR